MQKSKRLTKLILTSALMTLAALSIAAFCFTFDVKAAIKNIRSQATDVPAEKGCFRGNPGNEQKYLAEALGISEDELKAAQEEARKAMLADAVANGDITQEQVDLMEIRQTLSSYLDPRALQINALGITEDELKAYQDEHKSMEDILSEVGMTAEEYQEALQAAFESAVAQAVTDGVITQEQADLFLENFDQRLPGMGKPDRGQPPAQSGNDQSPSGTPPAPGQGGGPGMGGPGGFGNPGWFGNPGEDENPQPTATPSSTSDTNS